MASVRDFAPLHETSSASIFSTITAISTTFTASRYHQLQSHVHQLQSHVKKPANTITLRRHSAKLTGEEGAPEQRELIGRDDTENVEQKLLQANRTAAYVLAAAAAVAPADDVRPVENVMSVGRCAKNKVSK